MTAAQIAQLLNARRVGKGKWQAKCPSHPDRTPSLSIAEGRKVPVVLKCMSAGCDTREILAAVGLRMSDLFDGKPSPEIQQRMTREHKKEALERELGLVVMLGSIEKGKRSYWAAAERRIRGELAELRCWIEPEKVVREWQARKFQQKLREIGWNGICNEFEGSDEGRQIRRQHGIHPARSSSRQAEEDARTKCIHRGPPQLPQGWIQTRGGDGIGNGGYVG